MKNRRGIILLMFDLPAVTTSDRKEYYHFKKDLRRQGFIQFQESCYLRLVRNMENIDQTLSVLKTILPKEGNISILPLNLTVFKGMQCLLGESFNMALFTDDICCIGEAEDESA